MIYLALAIFLIFIAICVLIDRHSPACGGRVLADHDPNKPFTSDELRSIGIIPPEHYEDWLDEYARR